MNGISVMIDTNIAIALLNGDESLAEMFDGKDVWISFITELELLCKPGLKASEKKKSKRLLMIVLYWKSMRQ